MSSHWSRSMTRAVGRVFAVVAGLAFVAYLSSGREAIHTATSRAALHAVGVTHDWLQSSQLASLEQQTAVDRRRLEDTLACRKELQEQIRQLVWVRDDAIARRDAVRQRLSPMLAQLRTSLGEDTGGLSAGGRARAQELLTRRTDLGREIADSEESIRRLTASLSDLDQRIRQVRQQLSTQERESRLQRHCLEAESSRRELIARLQTLEAANGIR